MSKAGSKIDLSYDERLLLAAYEKILGNTYKFQDANRDAEHISRDHLQAQKIGYVLCQLKLLTNYSFSWNKRGPFSSKFQELLIGLDAKPSSVNSFYEGNAQQALNNLLPECLMIMLDKVGQVFNNYIDQDNITDDLELLGSLLYIGATVLPGQSFEQVNIELQTRKPGFEDDKRNLRAWTCLHESNLIPS